MSDLASLIAKLESASEDELGLWREVNLFAREAGWIDQDRCYYNLTVILSAFNRGDRNLLLAVALSLVPEGWTFGVNTFAPNEVFNPGGAQAYVMRADALGKSDAGGYQHAEAATPAIALCIAALHARAAA